MGLQNKTHGVESYHGVGTQGDASVSMYSCACKPQMKVFCHYHGPLQYLSADFRHSYCQ